MRVYLAVQEYVEEPDLLGFEVREVHETTVVLLAYDLIKEEMVGLLHVGYNECENGLASVLPVGDKEYIVQGVSRDKSNYLTFRVSPVTWSTSLQVTCQEGASVQYSPRLVLRYHSIVNGNLVLTLYDPFASVELEQLALTADDEQDNTVMVATIAGEKLAFQGQGLVDNIIKFRITPIHFPAVESTCNCNR